MRILLLVLVLANGLYFAWSHGSLAVFGWVPASYSEREPHRIEQQVRPGALQIKPGASSSSPQTVR